MLGRLLLVLGADVKGYDFPADFSERVGLFGRFSLASLESYAFPCAAGLKGSAPFLTALRPGV